MTRLQFFVLHILYLFLRVLTKQKIYVKILMKPTLGKAVNKDKVIKSPLCDLLCWFRLYLSTKIDPYSIYDILCVCTLYFVLYWPSYSIIFALGLHSPLAFILLGLSSLGLHLPWPSFAWPSFSLDLVPLVFIRRTDYSLVKLLSKCTFSEFSINC